MEARKTSVGRADTNTAPIINIIIIIITIITIIRSFFFFEKQCVNGPDAPPAENPPERRRGPSDITTAVAVTAVPASAMPAVPVKTVAVEKIATPTGLKAWVVQHAQTTTVPQHVCTEVAAVPVAVLSVPTLTAVAKKIAAPVVKRKVTNGAYERGRCSMRQFRCHSMCAHTEQRCQRRCR